LKITREYFENLYSSKLENEEKIDKFLYTYVPPKLNRRNINNLNRVIISSETETIIKNLPIKKSPDLNGFSAKIYQTFKEERTPIPVKLFHKL
jgi:hypothetical protein